MKWPWSSSKEENFSTSSYPSTTTDNKPDHLLMQELVLAPSTTKEEVPSNSALLSYSLCWDDKSQKYIMKLKETTEEAEQCEPKFRDKELGITESKAVDSVTEWNEEEVRYWESKIGPPKLNKDRQWEI